MQPSSAGSSSPITTVITVLAVVLALIGVGGVASGAADKPTEVASTGNTSTTLGVGGDFTTDTTAETSSGVDGSTGTTVAGGKTATTKTDGSGLPTATTVPATGNPCAAPGEATADPGPMQPPATGEYSYVNCEDETDVASAKVTAVTSTDGVTRRAVTDSSSGVSGTLTLAYGPSGVIMEALTASTPQGKFTCDWNPDITNYPAPLAVGKSWTSKSSCELKDSKGAKFGTLNFDGGGKVDGRVAVTIGGQKVNAWLINVAYTIVTQTAFGNVTANITQTLHYDSSRGLALYRSSDAATNQGSVKRIDRLASLTPKA